MIYDDDLAVTALASSEGNDAVGCGDDRRAVVCGDVLPGVEFRRVAAEGIATVAEAIRQPSVNRLDGMRHGLLSDSFKSP